jgi:hypothetical protein
VSSTKKARAVPEVYPKSFQEFVKLVERRQRARGPLWFRGAGKATYKLLPTLYRHRSHHTVEALELLERNLMMRFQQRSIPFMTRALADNWDSLFFMQHYGVPTRLLDWTENPFIGLYFAIMSSPFSGKLVGGKAELSFSSDAAVWILDPVAWNKHALRLQRFDRGILMPSDEALQSYKPLTRFPDMNVHPVAIYGAHNSPRIVAQRGSFMIFGQSTQGMEDAYVQEPFPVSCLQKVILSRDVLQAMRTSVLKNGITESVVFPDLEGLSREIKRDFEFEY